MKEKFVFSIGNRSLEGGCRKEQLHNSKELRKARICYIKKDKNKRYHWKGEQGPDHAGLCKHCQDILTLKNTVESLQGFK